MTAMITELVLNVSSCSDHQQVAYDVPIPPSPPQYLLQCSVVAYPVSELVQQKCWILVIRGTIKSYIQKLCSVTASNGVDSPAKNHHSFMEVV